MAKVIERVSMHIVRMANTTGTGPRGSGIGIYRDPSGELPCLSQVRSVLLLGSNTGRLSIVFAPALTGLILLGIVVSHVTASMLAEYAENMRFRGEIDPLLLLLGVISLYAIAISSRETPTSPERE